MNVTPGWLYSVRQDKLVVEFGNAHTSYRYNGMFEVDNNRRVIINGKPWTVYNNFIWCPNVERDDIRAVKLFIEHEYREIEKLKKQLSKHEDKCATLNILLMVREMMANNKSKGETL